MGDRYTFVEEIARGGFGRVDKVHNLDGELFARKTFDPSPQLGVRKSVEEWLEEIRAFSSRLKKTIHPMGMGARNITE